MSNEAHENGFKAARKWILMGDAEEMPNESHIRNYVEGAIKAYLDASGLVLVPREPTDEMKLVGGLKCESMMFENDEDYTGVIFSDMGFVYRSMIAAAPNPFESKQDE